MDNQEPQQQVQHAIRELLQERQELLVAFCQAAGIAPELAGDDEKSVLQRLCQLLMDYAALWQFEIHDSLVNENLRTKITVGMLEKQDALIADTATVMLDFNDLVDASLKAGQHVGLESRLSELGETLAERFEAEDRVISALRGSDGINRK